MKFVFKLLSIVATLIALVCLVCLANYGMKIYYDKDLPGKNVALRDPEQKFDVLFIGTSHLGAIQPCQLWERHGISSYNSYNDANSMVRNLASLKLSLQYCEPQLVILETEHWWDEPEFEDALGAFHHSFDTYPTTAEKVQVISDVADDNKQTFKELLIPFYRYHSRWQELAKEDFDPQIDYYMGARIRQQANEFEQYPIMGEDYRIGDKDTQYVEAIIQECQNRNINILLLELPYICGDEVQGRQNALYDVAEKYNIGFLNMTNYEGLVDYTCDFRDKEHMNLAGGLKCADFLAEYIKEAYAIPDRRCEASYSKVWAENMSRFAAGLNSYVKDCGGIDEAMNFLCMDQYEGEILINDTSLIEDDVVLYHQLISTPIVENGLQRVDEIMDEAVSYCLSVTRDGIQADIKELVGDQATNEIRNLAGECSAYVCIRDAKTKDVIVEKSF